MADIRMVSTMVSSDGRLTLQTVPFLNDRDCNGFRLLNLESQWLVTFSGQKLEFLRTVQEVKASGLCAPGH